MSKRKIVRSSGYIKSEQENKKLARRSKALLFMMLVGYVLILLVVHKLRVEYLRENQHILWGGDEFHYSGTSLKSSDFENHLGQLGALSGIITSKGSDGVNGRYFELNDEHFRCYLQESAYTEATQYNVGDAVHLTGYLSKLDDQIVLAGCTFTEQVIHDHSDDEPSENGSDASTASE